MNDVVQDDADLLFLDTYLTDIFKCSNECRQSRYRHFLFYAQTIVVQTHRHHLTEKEQKNSKKVVENFARNKIMSIFALEISQTLMPRWRNRQTRWSQTPVGSPLCRFDPGSGYRKPSQNNFYGGLFFSKPQKWSLLVTTLKMGVKKHPKKGLKKMSEISLF